MRARGGGGEFFFSPSGQERAKEPSTPEIEQKAKESASASLPFDAASGSSVSAATILDRSRILLSHLVDELKGLRLLARRARGR